MISWIFLAVACWGALWTLMSFRPPRRPGWLMMFGFFAAWWTTELAPMHLLWQFVAVVVFVALGALQSWVGWLALAITLVSWFGIAWNLKVSLGTDGALTGAFRDALPDDEAGASKIEWA